ncbi:hypothetical protein ACA910_006728 [Epithemia clementina (nom. ined.)]
MLRRQVAASPNNKTPAATVSSPTGGATCGAAPQKQRRLQIGRPGSAKPRSKAVDIGIGVLLVGAFLLTVATYLFPDVRHAEEEQWNQMMKMSGQQKPPLKMDGDHAGQNYPSLNLDEISTKWVDGEKKLKRRLEKLAQRQASGMDIGVPVLTRWLGEDIPAWPTDPDHPMDVDEWKKKVEERYTEMRQEEMEWRMQVTHYLEDERG